jgi:hypothetical protein
VIGRYSTGTLARRQSLRVVDHYPLAIDLDGRRRWVLWFDDDPSGVVCADGTVVSFLILADLRTYAADLGLALVHEAAAIDLDRVLAWESEPNVRDVLDVWNLITDVASSVERPFHDGDSGHDALYDKVFSANNLPAMTPPGESCEPSWKQAELMLLRSLLTDGVELVREALSGD